MHEISMITPTTNTLPGMKSNILQLNRLQKGK